MLIKLGNQVNLDKMHTVILIVMAIRMEIVLKVDTTQYLNLKLLHLLIPLQVSNITSHYILGNQENCNSASQSAGYADNAQDYYTPSTTQEDIPVTVNHQRSTYIVEEECDVITPAEP